MQNKTDRDGHVKHTAVSDFWKKICPALIKMLPAVLAVVAFYGIFGCPIRFMTGISCPGCGMTRAYLCLLRGDVEGAFNYHPLFPLVPIGIILCFCRSRLPGGLINALLAIGVLLFIGVYIYRLLDPSDPVVTADFGQGFYGRLWQALCRFAGGIFAGMG